MTHRQATFFGVLDLVSALAVATAVFPGLGERWWPVDLAATLFTTVLGVTGAALLLELPWAPRAARAAAWLVLTGGAGLVVALALTASYVDGIYGTVGRHGAVELIVAAGLALPYLVVLPAAQLVWFWPTRAPAP